MKINFQTFRRELWREAFKQGWDVQVFVPLQLIKELELTPSEFAYAMGAELAKIDTYYGCLVLYRQ